MCEMRDFAGDAFLHVSSAFPVDFQGAASSELELRCGGGGSWSRAADFSEQHGPGEEVEVLEVVEIRGLSLRHRNGEPALCSPPSSGCLARAGAVSQPLCWSIPDTW